MLRSVCHGEIGRSCQCFHCSWSLAEEFEKFQPSRRCHRFAHSRNLRIGRVLQLSGQGSFHADHYSMEYLNK